MSKDDEALARMAAEATHGALETLSAYMDGELAAEHRDGLLQAVKAGNGLHAEWSVYHCIGDVLRSDDTAFVRPAFAQRLKTRLDAEPFLFAPEVAKAYAARQAQPAVRWRVPLSVAAGVAAVLVVGAMVVPQRGADAPPTVLTPTVAVAPQSDAASQKIDRQTAAAEPAARPISSEYLIAHRNYSTGLAMRGVVSHVRSAGYDGK